MLLADDRELAHLVLRVLYHPPDDSHDALGQGIAQTVGVEGIIVLNNHATRLNLNVNLELRHVQLQQFLADGLSAYGVLRQHAHLIGIGDGRMETIIGGDAGKGIVLVAQCLVEGIAGLTEEVGHRHVIDTEAEGEGVDEHTHGVGNLQVRTATADGTEIYIAVVGVAADNV